MRLIALKLNYNDGGAKPGSVFGYRGICSNTNIEHNIAARRDVWCSQPECPCSKFRDRGYDGRRPSGAVCYESQLLKSRLMVFAGGIYHSPGKRGLPIPVRGVGRGDVALLTTLLPEAKGPDRIIFGCFRVGRVCDGKWGKTFKSDGKMDEVFPDNVARRLMFWKYRGPNKNKSLIWGSGLVRYMPETKRRHLQFFADLFEALGACESRDRIIAALPELRPLISSNRASRRCARRQ